MEVLEESGRTGLKSEEGCFLCCHFEEPGGQPLPILGSDVKDEARKGAALYV